MSTRLSHAIQLATSMHDGLLDKSGLPSILHPLRVMNAVALAHPLNEDAAIVAVLHDTVEDTPLTLRHIFELFGTRVRDGVDAVTRRIDTPMGKEPYGDFIKRVKKNELGRLVKCFDLRDNIAREGPPELQGIKKRYHRALAELM